MKRTNRLLSKRSGQLKNARRQCLLRKSHIKVLNRRKAYSMTLMLEHEENQSQA